MGWPRFDLECSSLDHWRWKYERGFINRKVIAVSVSEDRIVGVNHAVPVNVKIGETISSCYQATDLAIASDFRRMGLFPKMSAIKTGLHEKYGSMFNYGATGNPRAIESSIKAGLLGFPRPIASLSWIDDVDLHVKMTRKDNSLAVKTGIRLLKVVSKKSMDRREESRKFQIREISRFEDEFIPFWNEVKLGYDFILERNLEYLNLRYCDTRGGNYIIYNIEENNKTLGYLVLNINRLDADYPVGSIVDLLTYPYRLDTAEALLTHAINFFIKQNVNYIRYMVVRDHPYEKIFKNKGFIDSRQLLRVNLHPMNIEAEWDKFMKAPANRLHFQYGDTDWI